MFAHSSISNSDRPSSAAEAFRLFLRCVAFLAMVRVVFMFWGPEWSDRWEVTNAREYLRASKTREVRVVVFGSSHMRSAFLSEQWAARAGLREDQVINLSLDSGRFWDARYLLRETGDLADSVDLVLLEAPKWNFNRNRVNPLTRIVVDYPESLRQHGGLRDRLSVDGWANRVGLMAEAIWPVYQRRTLEGWVDHLVSSSQPIARLPAESIHWDESLHATLRAHPRFRARKIVLDHFSDPELSSFTKRNFRLLVKALRRRGAEVAIVTLPSRDAYHEVRDADPGRTQFIEEVDEVIASTLGNGVFAIDCHRARDCGQSGRIFVDYGHLNKAGARSLTSALFDEIEKRRGES